MYMCVCVWFSNTLQTYTPIRTGIYTIPLFLSDLMQVIKDNGFKPFS